MATTLCLVYFAPDGVYMAHAGDSRIYQFRKGEMIFKTEDHSLVNSMIKNGKISPQDAHKHPQRNVIYRAIQGSHTPVEIDVVKITDVLPDDEFFMCTDGVTEVWSDDDLCKVFYTNNSTEEKINRIKEECREKARDNYSAYLIPIRDVNKINVLKQLFLYVFM
jgi:protein phosphatase